MTIHQKPSPGRWRGRIALIVLILCALGAVGWRYRVTRPDYCLARGEAAVLAKDWDAVVLYAERLEVNGHANYSYLLRGQALYARGHPDLAVVVFNKIRSGGSIQLKAAVVQGRCLLDLGELKEAHRVFIFILSGEPYHTDARRSLAAVVYDRGQLNDAVDHLQRAAELDTADARPHRLIGLIYKDMAQYAPAAAAYREALRRGLTGADAGQVRLELAEILTQQAQFEEALRLLDEGEHNRDESSDHIAARAECLLGLGRHDEAAAALDQALSSNQTLALCRVRGQVYLDQGRPADAATRFERAAELAPANHQARYLLAQAYSALGRTDDAARELARSEAIRNDLDRLTKLTQEAIAEPWNAVVRRELAKVCERMGKPQLAELWRKAAAACSQPPTDLGR